MYCAHKRSARTYLLLGGKTNAAVSQAGMLLAQRNAPACGACDTANTNGEAVFENPA